MKHANRLVLAAAGGKPTGLFGDIEHALSWAVKAFEQQEAVSLLLSSVRHRYWKLNVRQGRYMDATYRTLCMWPTGYMQNERTALEVLLLYGQARANSLYNRTFRFLSTARGQSYFMNNIEWRAADTCGFDFRTPYNEAWAWTMPTRAPKSLWAALREVYT